MSLSASIVVITAGLGVPSSSRLLSDAMLRAMEKEMLENSITPESTTYELRDYAVDIAYNMTNGYANPNLQEMITAVEKANVLIAVTPVFTASMSGLFKSFFDVIDNQLLNGKTVIIGATGGTSRHSMVTDHAIRPMFNYLKAHTVRTAVYATPDDWGVGGDSVSLEQRIQKAVHEAIVIMPRQTAIPKPVESFLPLEEMLASIKRS